MEKNNVQITLLQAIEVLTNPQSKDKSIIKEAIRVLGIKTFLLNIDSYDITEPVKKKLIDLSNIVEEFINNLTDKNQGGGNIG